MEVRVWEDSGGLPFSVSDDGPGFDAARARGGHGFVNMADRLGAIGGTVRWESAPGHGARILGLGAAALTVTVSGPRGAPGSAGGRASR